MIESILDGLLDTVKILPYLFVTFLALELIEHKLSKKAQESIAKHKRLGPVIGGAIGGFPQCGFSAMASKLYANRIITMGTVVAIFLSTSDEMLPVMLSENVPVLSVMKIIGVKVVIGIVVGVIVDLVFGNKVDGENKIKEMCDDEHCHCEKGILLSSVIHTLKTGAFVLVANVIIGMIIYLVGEETLAGLLGGKNIFVYIIASLIGLIPNCAASVILTEAYVSNVIPIGVAMAGLLTGSGVGMLLLIKNNKNMKENLIILAIVYAVGVTCGMLMDVVGMG